jgi:hypothetical protein
LNDLYGYKIYVFFGTAILMSVCGNTYAYFLASFVTNPNALATGNVVSTIKFY